MTITIINPNSDPEMTSAIQKAADSFVSGRYNVECIRTETAPKFIETYADQQQAAPGMLEIVRANEKGTDAFIVACHCDPNLDLLKEATKKPVVGIGEASMKLATMLGHSFSVVSTDLHSVPNKEAVIRKYHLEDLCISVRTPGQEFSESSPEEKYLAAAQQAVDEDLAEVIVLGCAGLAGLDRDISEKLGVPVLDGVVCALIIAEGLVHYGVSTSKIRRYNPEY